MADDASTIPVWRRAGHRYHRYGQHLRKRFGGRIQKVSLDAGMTCPNVDGTVAEGGCVFCDNRSFSPSRRVKRRDVLEQLEDGITRLRRRYPDCRGFVAYFQPATNTYAPVARLRPLFERALSHPEVVGLAIGTRPDCLADDVLELLQELATGRYLSLEIGMQTMHDRSLTWMNRGHDHESTRDAMRRCQGRPWSNCLHLILGLPGESGEDWRSTADEVARLRPDAVKIHNLYVVEGTPLAEQVRRGEVRLIEREEYIAGLVDVLERLPPEVVVERISGDAPGGYFIGPAWSLDKPGIRIALDAELERRDTWQGRLLRTPS